MNKAINFTNSLINHAKDGFKRVDDTVYSSRLAICQSCEYYDDKNITCKTCGCFLDIKARWNSEKCPIDKW
jgi:hypothetical protein